MSFACVVLASAIVSITGMLLRKKFGDEAPGPAILFFVAWFLLLGCASWFNFLFLTVGNLGVMLIKFSLSLLAWVPASYQFSQIVSSGASHFFVNFVYASSIFSRAKRHYGKAGALAKKGDFMGAKQAYLTYFKESPEVPDPLFAAAHMLEMNDRPADAERMYKALLQSFEKNDAVWGRAAWLLAALYDHRLKRPNEARALCHQIMRRVPKSESGKRAVAWLVQHDEKQTETPLSQHLQ